MKRKQHVRLKPPILDELLTLRRTSNWTVNDICRYLKISRSNAWRALKVAGLVEGRKPKAVMA